MCALNILEIYLNINSLFICMDIVTIILLGISLILFFGYLSEFTFRKLGIPDVLFLIILGVVIGPHGFGWVVPAQLATVAPIFTTFTLLFLLFDGAFNINLRSLLLEFSQSFILTIFNFVLSSITIMAIMLVFKFGFAASLFTGFALGGVSSAFVIPLLKQMNIKPKLYSLLTLESALTDVFCIVFALTVIEVVKLGGFGLQKTFAQITSLFAVGAVVGIVAGIIWIYLVLRVIKEHNYMVTIAYVILVFVLAQFLKGNGAIATLFFGLMLNNSKQLSTITKEIVHNNSQILEKKKRKKKITKTKGPEQQVTTRSEQHFYHQISFFLKTFFFVYIGLLIDLSHGYALLIGGIISVAMLFVRRASWVLTRKEPKEDRGLVNSIFARGLAAAAIAQIALQEGINHAATINKIIYVVITGTIVLSSIMVFIDKYKYKNKVVTKA
jgi:potassium/hydrogen antiporter